MSLTKVFNGEQEPLFVIYGKLNNVVEEMVLDYPDPSGEPKKEVISRTVHNLQDGSIEYKSRGYYKSFEINYKEFCTIANYQKVSRLLDYFHQAKKIFFFPHREGNVNYEVVLHPDFDGLEENLIYDSKTHLAIGYENVSIRVITKYLQIDRPLYSTDISNYAGAFTDETILGIKIVA